MTIRIQYYGIDKYKIIVEDYPNQINNENYIILSKEDALSLLIQLGNKI